MKRFLLACFLMTATCSVVSVQHAMAQSSTPPTQASFATKVTQLDNYITAGDMTNAQTTWESIHTDMLAELAYTKSNIAGGGTPTGGGTYMTIMNNQRTIYSDIWQLHTDMVTNHTALIAKLNEFDGTIY